MFDNQVILVTGGTGSFGHMFTKMTLSKFHPKKLIIFSRDEMKQWEMAKKFSKYPCMRFFIGDVRDEDRLTFALRGVDYVVHAAATKIVPTAEYNPQECIKTNIFGAINVIHSCVRNNVKKVVALSTDKACAPVNLYGSTKLTSDKLFAAANLHFGRDETRFSVVRYGNVMGSRGSVIPFFLNLIKNGSKTLPITDERMTRFMITLDQAVMLVWKAFEDMLGGELYVKKIPSMRVVDIAHAISNDAKFEIIGIRPGEKLHEQMITAEDAMNTYEYNEYYKYIPQILNDSRTKKRIKNGKRVPDGFSYSSNTNSEWMDIETLRLWLKNMNDNILI